MKQKNNLTLIQSWRSFRLVDQDRRHFLSNSENQSGLQNAADLMRPSFAGNMSSQQEAHKPTDSQVNITYIIRR